MENVSWSHSNTSTKAKGINTRSAFAAEWGTIKPEVGNQILRTEEDSMEMGTMEWVLPNDHIVLTERPDTIAGNPMGISA